MTGDHRIASSVSLIRRCAERDVRDTVRALRERAAELEAQAEDHRRNADALEAIAAAAEDYLEQNEKYWQQTKAPVAGAPIT